MIMAAEFKDVGDHLLGIGTSWGEQGLKVALLVIVVVKIAQKASLKAGIGALLGLVICMGIYESRGDLAKYVKDEVTSVGAPAVDKRPLTGPATVQTPRGGSGPV